jgi:ATP-dependent DNA ligase
LRKIRGDFIFDCEIIGKNFNSLQHRSHLTDKIKIDIARKKYPLFLMIFDVLSFNDKLLTYEKLKERIIYLNQIEFENLNHIGFVAYEDINECLDYAKKRECEGIVIKNMNSAYENRRSFNWLKLKLFKETEIKAIKYTENPAGIRVEDSEGIAVQIAGEQHKEVKKRIDENSYCEIIVQYLEKTQDNKLRFPSYRGLK